MSEQFPSADQHARTPLADPRAVLNARPRRFIRAHTHKAETPASEWAPSDNELQRLGLQVQILKLNSPSQMVS